MGLRSVHGRGRRGGFGKHGLFVEGVVDKLVLIFAPNGCKAGVMSTTRNERRNKRKRIYDDDELVIFASIAVWVHDLLKYRTWCPHWSN